MRTSGKVSKRKFTFKERDTVHIIDPDSVLLFEKVYHKTAIIKIDGSTESISVSLDELEHKLSRLPFWRSDDAHIINLQFLEKVSDSENILIMIGRIKVPIDSDRKALLIDELSKID